MLRRLVVPDAHGGIFSVELGRCHALLCHVACHAAAWTSLSTVPVNGPPIRGLGTPYAVLPPALGLSAPPFGHPSAVRALFLSNCVSTSNSYPLLVTN
jgi:hypothetical protein